MANADVDFGFIPWGPVLRARLYAVPTAPTINICLNDLVAMDTVGGIVTSKLGLVGTVYDAAVLGDTPGDEYQILGGVLACFDHKMDPIQYIPPATVGDSTVAGYVLIADHPHQLYVANMGEAAVTAADMDLNYPIDGQSLYAPQSTSTGISTQFIKTSNAAVTATIPIRLYGQAYPGVDVYSAVGCRMICGLNPDCCYWASDVTI
jgi:hypothetical protein